MGQGWVKPLELADRGVRITPLGLQHEDGLRAAAADGELWNIRVTSVPRPEDTRKYIEDASKMYEEGKRVAFAVTDAATGQVLGTSSYHDILPEVKRLEIGYTWYAKSRQRTALNTTCKLLLMQHAFDTLGAKVVGWRTDNYNYASQRAIERLGAKKEAVLRGHALRRDGTIRDTVIYSVTAGEWPEVKAHLLYQLDKPR